MKKITKEQYYHALALYMLAVRKGRELDRLHKELHEVLNEEHNGHFSDAIYGNDNDGMELDFRETMTLAKIELED
jgi:hypothetical protein